MSDAKIRLCRLYEKQSARGTRYFVGRLGAARLLLFQSREIADDGGAIWDLFVQELEDKRPDARPARSSGEQPFAKSDRPSRLPSHQEARPDDPLDDVLP